ncbi:MAG: RHS repeat domain-containing protein, partial [Candidatus Binatia bacterium]
GWGRYSQADPIGIAASLNLFGYAARNPVKVSDPLGLMSLGGSCIGFGDCGCSKKISQALQKFNDSFKPG